jgi:hypothetical protein
MMLMIPLGEATSALSYKDRYGYSIYLALSLQYCETFLLLFVR